MPSVSYSETSTYLLCKRKHFYGYTRSLQRVVESSSLALGGAGHKVLQAYYTSILNEGDNRAKQGTKAAKDRALQAAAAQYVELVADGFKDDPAKAPLKEIVFDFYIANEPLVSNGWVIQAVEMEFRLDVMVEEDGEMLSTPFVVDLIAVDPDGKTVVIDHKFVYDFYTYEDASLQPQIPLYLAGLRGLGHTVHYGMYNMLRNRSIKGTKAKDGSYPGATWEQRWQSLDVTPNAVRVKRTFEEQIDTAKEIQALKLLTPEEVDLKSHRVANKMVCQSCSFKDLCKIELQGGNAALVIKSEYKIRERKVFAESVEAEGTE